jgi:hypothetical protein
MQIRRGALLAVAVLAPTLVARGGRAAVPVASAVRVAGVTSPLGWPYSSFTEGTVDASGQLVFVASSSAIFESQGTTLVQRIGAGNVMPDGRRIAGVGPPALAADGCVIVRSTFVDGGEAVVRACGTTFSVVIDAGTLATGGGTIRALDPAVFVAGADTIAASGTLEDGTSVVLRHDAGGLVELARTGTAAPSGGTYAAFRLLGVTTQGQVGMHATVSDGPDGLFVADATGSHTLVVVGQGSPVGGSFSSIGGGTIHPGGRWAFRASLSTDASGIFSVDLSDPLRIVRAVVMQGDALPIAGATIRSFPGSIDPSINATGTVAFRALIEGATDPPRPSGVFTATPTGAVTQIVAVREDLQDIGTINRLRDPAIADDGSLLVSAVVAGEGPGLFVARPGAFVPLARLGDATDVDTGDSRFLFGPGSLTTAAEHAVFLGSRDAIFRTAGDGSTAALAYAGRPSPLGGVIATLGPPVVDGAGDVYFGADFQNATVNEALLVSAGGTVDVLLSPDRRLLGGGGISELFPTSVDALARPSASPIAGVGFTAALRGAKAAEAVFFARSRSRIRATARVGQHAQGQRLASFGTPSIGPRNALGILVEVGRDHRRNAVVASSGGRLGVVAMTETLTRSRAGGRFAELDPPIAGAHGTVFRATLDGSSSEGIFIGRGRRVGLVAGTGDMTTAGGRLRTFLDPLAVGDEVWFLARVAGSVAPAGLYHVHVSAIPKRSDAPLEVEPVLLPGDPTPLGGVIVRLGAPRVGPSGTVSVVADIGGGTATSAILQFAPAS